MSAVPPKVHFFYAYLPLVRLSSVLVILVVVGLAVLASVIAARVAQWALLAVAGAYAAASCFGPAQWVLTAPGPDLDATGDVAGWAWLLTVDVLLAALTASSIVVLERRSQARRPHREAAGQQS